MATNAIVTNSNVLPNVTGKTIPINVTIEELNTAESAKHLGVLIFCVSVMVMGILGNVLVLVIYKLKFKRSSARTYILALAMSDLSVCLIGIPYHVLDLTMLLVYDSTSTCKVLSVLIGACTNSSVFILLVVGLDRFLKVCRPLKKQMIDFGDGRACLIAAAVASCLAIPNAVLYGHSTVKTEIEGLYGVTCFIDDAHAESTFSIIFMGMNVLIFIASLFILVAIYGLICKKIYRRSDGKIELNDTTIGCCNCLKIQEKEEYRSDNEIIDDGVFREEMIGIPADTTCDKEEAKEKHQISLQKENKSPKDAAAGERGKYSTSKCRSGRTGTTKSSSSMVCHVQNKEKNTKRVTVMMLAITAVFAISYLPYITICCLTSLDESYWDNMGHSESIINELILRIYLINNATNPVIYSFMDIRFRKHCISVFKYVSGCGSSDWKTVNMMSSRYIARRRQTVTT